MLLKSPLLIVVILFPVTYLKQYNSYKVTCDKAIHLHIFKSKITKEPSPSILHVLSQVIQTLNTSVTK